MILGDEKTWSIPPGRSMSRWSVWTYLRDQVKAQNLFAQGSEEANQGWCHQSARDFDSWAHRSVLSVVCLLTLEAGQFQVLAGLKAAIRLDLLQKVLDGDLSLSETAVEAANLKDKQKCHECFMHLARLDTWEECLEKYHLFLQTLYWRFTKCSLPYCRCEFWADEKRLQSFYKLFRHSKVNVPPAVFLNYMNNNVLVDHASEVTRGNITTAEFRKAEAHYAVCNVSVTSLPKSIPKVPFTLAIMDVPYGIKADDWDEEVRLHRLDVSSSIGQQSSTFWHIDF